MRKDGRGASIEPVEGVPKREGYCVATAIRASSPEQRRTVGRGRWAHRSFSALIFAIVVLLSAGLALLGAQGAFWAWPAIGLPILYIVGALLYRWESKRRLPGWVGEALEAVATFWPPIKWLATSDEIQAANEAFVNDFNLTLKEYGFKPLTQGEELAERVRPLKVSTLAQAWVKEYAPDSPGEDDSMPSVDALELLHRERSGGVTVSLWQARKDGLIHELAWLLLRNRRVPAADPVHPFTEADISALLIALRDFDIDLIAEELRAVNRLGRRLQRYAEFLQAGRQEPAREIDDITSLIAEHRGGLPAGPLTMFRLESPGETLKLMEAIEECDDPSVSAVHRGIFLAERDADAGALKGQVCAFLSQWSANGDTDPIRVLQAYLWEKDKREKNKCHADPITPDELNSEWQRWSDNAKEALGETAGGFEADRQQLVGRLEAGIWPTRRTARDSLDPYPPPPPIPAPEHEEIRDLDAYLITFDERRGSLAEVIDGLKKQNSIYRFGPYTRYTRLGIVPRGMPFHEFVEQFFADLDDALRRHRPGLDSLTSAELAMRFVADQPHSVVLKHDHQCEGPVKFAIIEPLRRCNHRGEVESTTQADPEDGELGEIERWPDRARHALVRYYPKSVASSRRVRFAYTSSCADEQESHVVQVLVEPRGQGSPLDQIEVTVNRIDLPHCRELRFGDPALGPVMRSPSIQNVWKTIEPDLEKDERPSVRAAFDRVAGLHGLP